MHEEVIEAGLQRLDPELAGWVRTQWNALTEKTKEEDFQALQPCLDTLPNVWAASEFIARTCVSRPRLLVELVSSGDLFSKYRDGELTRRIRAVSGGNEVELMRELRSIRLREAVRIAWRDLSGLADLDEVVSLMSELADACAGKANDCAYSALCERVGIPHGEISGKPVRMTLLALGKLGGRELNFSSDVDLIFAYSETGKTRHSNRISNHEFFLKLARDLIRILENPTGEGLVFRVDMRLRPNGNSGPLALSFDAMEQYYQTHGRDWERYALIKARIIGDDDAGNELLTRLKPFVYRRYLDYGAFEAVRSMKDMINRELKRKGVQNNLKLGRGGIREIEFIAQSFQLIRGGRERSLQTNRLFEALDQLARGGIIDGAMHTELIADYTYLRRLEHRVQMIRDQQTHRLPERDVDRKRLLAATGHEGWSELTHETDAVCARVHGHFDQIFVPVRETSTPGPDEIADLWMGLVDDASAFQALSNLGYHQPENTTNAIRSLKQSRVYRAHSKVGQERLDRLMPMCVREAGQSSDPDATLSRLIQFMEGIGRRSAYLVLLIENPQALSQLVRLIAASPWISSWIRQHPLLLDELLGPITDSMESSREQMNVELDQRLAHVEKDDLEQQMDILREVRHGQNLRVAAADISGTIDWVEAGQRLSMIAETILSYSVNLCIDGLCSSIGIPSADVESTPPTLGIVAYGKLGSRELGYNSDLDIVFLHHGTRPGGGTEHGARSIDNTQYYMRLVQRMVHFLTTRTAAGVLYEVDMRLRPSGRAGPVVTSLDGYHNYQKNRAWTWEHQALARARMVVGPEPFRARFDEIRQDILCQPREQAALKREIKDMRARMSAAHDASNTRVFDLKHGEGGIVDIEFIVQYFVLQWASDHPEIIISRSNIELIKSFCAAGLMGEGEGSALADAYYRYLTAEHQAKLTEQPAEVPAGEYLQQRDHVKMLWRRLFD